LCDDFRKEISPSEFGFLTTGVLRSVVVSVLGEIIVEAFFSLAIGKSHMFAVFSEVVLDQNEKEVVVIQTSQSGREKSSVDFGGFVDIRTTLRLARDTSVLGVNGFATSVV
jgi:hypothetical protein